MEVICWGVRGSLPSSGRAYSQYGGDTTCIEILSRRGTRIIIDAGTGIRKLARNIKNDTAKTINLLLSHYHLDHIMGTPFIPQLFNREYHFNIFGPATEGASNVRTPFETTISPPYFPLALENKAIQAHIDFHTIGETTLSIGDFKVSTIRLSHTNRGGLGFCIEEDDKKFVFLTDNELRFSHPCGRNYHAYTAFARDADLLLHDAQYTTQEYENHRGWGHSSIAQVIAFGKETRARKIGFIHYDIDRNDTEINQLYTDVSTTEQQDFIPVHQEQHFTL
jgi:ribonuclease BN (tRNA processing enzyme)